MDKFIVAEISKNWRDDVFSEELISQKFEKVINTNHERGYNLKEWKLSSTITDNCFNETIIAIFKLRE